MSKVTFIYAHEVGEKWSTPLSLIHEFESRGWETDIVSIGSNSSGVYHSNNLAEWLNTHPNPDIVMFMDFGKFDSHLLDKSLLSSAYWVQESGDDPQNFERNYPKSTKFDITLTPDHNSYIEYRNRGINAHWWTHFADTSIQFPMAVPIEYVAVTSRGMGGSEFLDTITQHSNGAIANKRGFEGIEHSKFLQSGLMVIQHSRWGEITRRIFEAMACGKMVITDRLGDNTKLNELFEEGREIIFYDDMVDCINKINYYKENELEREVIAKNGKNAVLKSHTQKQRVEFILNQYNIWKESRYE